MCKEITINIIKSWGDNMKNKLWIIIPIIIGGIGGFFSGIYDVNLNFIDKIMIVLAIFLLELIIFTISHELSHGFVAEKNGLKFSVLYLGPFTFKRENNKFTRIKGISRQMIYLGRAQIDNGEILNKQDIEKTKQAWIRALKAGPNSDMTLSILMIILALVIKLPELIVATLLLDVVFISSYIIGDGKHIKSLKNDEVFADVILYTYSIAGNRLVSKRSKDFLIDRLINDIEENEVSESSIVSMALCAHSVYVEGVCNNIKSLPHNINKIVELSIKYKNIFMKKQIESSYYRGLINTAILYEALINNDKEKALELYKYVKNENHNLPGEMLDFYRVEHVLGIANRKSEILNKNLMNPAFKGCEGVENIEKTLNKLILEKDKTM